MTNYISTQYSYVVVIVSHGTFFYRALAGRVKVINIILFRLELFSVPLVLYCQLV